ncbi:MAG: hypothetical protein Kow0058_14980 [Roseovarius sp.]
MLDHYRELLGHYRSSVFWGAVIAAALTLGLSLLLLNVMPIYSSTVVLNMQPSEEALRFNREFMDRGQFNPATIITQTHIERLLSDPVAERALDILLDEGSEDILASEPTLVDVLMETAWRWWALLNYGYFIEPDQRTQYLKSLKKAISVDFVEGSYIIRVEARHQYPELTARIVNAYADAYIEIASADFRDQVFNSVQVVDNRIAKKLDELNGLLTEREKLRESLGVRDVQLELTIMLESRQTLLKELQDAEIELARLQSELAYLEQTLGSRPRDREGLLNPQRRKIADKKDEIAFRRKSIAELDSALDGLSEKQRQLDKLEDAITATQSDLDKLRETRVSLELGSDARMSQVRVVSPGKPAIYPDAPKVLMNTVIAGVVGALLVVVALIVFDTLGTRVRTKADLQALIGPRALPTVNRRFRNLFRTATFRGGRAAQRRLREFATTISQRMGANPDPGGDRILITGFMDAPEIERAARLIRAVLHAQFGDRGKGAAIRVEAIPPVSATVSWDDLPEGRIVVAVPVNRIEEVEIRAIQKVGHIKPRSPYMMMWS